MLRVRGVTLVEVSVTLALVALLFMAVGPDLMLWMRNLEVRRTAESMHGGLQRARAEAVQRNRNVSFWLMSTNEAGQLDGACASSATGRGWVVSADNPAGLCDRAPSPTEAPLIVDKWSFGGGAAALPVNAQAADGEIAATCVTFNGFGRVADGGCAAQPLATITVGSGMNDLDIRPLRIEVRNGGSVRLCDTRVVADNDPRRCCDPRAPADDRRSCN